MALLFADGFDNYGADASDIHVGMVSSGWHYVYSPPHASVLTPNSVGMSMRLYAGIVSRLFGLQTDVIVGFSYQFSATCDDVIACFRYNPDYRGCTIQDMMKVKGNGLGGITVEVINAVGPAYQYSVPGLIQPGAFAFIEVRYAPHDTSGTIRVRVNGEEVISFTGETRGSHLWNEVNDISLPHQTGIEFSGLNYAYYDNFYICDTTGSAPFNDFLGEFAIIRRTLTTDATPNDWTPSTGSTHYNLWPTPSPLRTPAMSRVTRRPTASCTRAVPCRPTSPRCWR